MSFSSYRCHSSGLLCYATYSIYVANVGLASVCLGLLWVACALIHLFDVEKETVLPFPSSYTPVGKRKKSQAVPRRKLKPWGLSKIVKKKRRKERRGTVRPKLSSQCRPSPPSQGAALNSSPESKREKEIKD